MSKENVEIVRRAFDAWNAGEMGAFRALYDDAVILRTPEGWPEPGPFVGLDSVMREFEHAREDWDDDALEPIGEFIDAGDRVVARYVWSATGRGPDTEMELTSVWTLRRQKICFMEMFRDHAEALEAAGLLE
jgi:ketosteroid isomerase-like protein